MKIAEKIKLLFRRQPQTEEQVAARAKAERDRDQIRQEAQIRTDTQVPPF